MLQQDWEYFPGTVWKVLSLLEAFGNKVPYLETPKPLGEGQQDTGVRLDLLESAHPHSCSCSSTAVLVSLSQFPLSSERQSSGEFHKSVIPKFMSSYFGELQEEKTHLEFSCRNNNTWGLLRGSKFKKKIKIPAVNLKWKLSFGFRPGTHPTHCQDKWRCQEFPAAIPSFQAVLGSSGGQAELSHN